MSLSLCVSVEALQERQHGGRGGKKRESGGRERNDAGMERERERERQRERQRERGRGREPGAAALLRLQ